ncbi:hypothetical protein INT44_003504 [Umbelopsis vinacea]|uniref:SH3 domain-containing protein n=1 Tax=Umbelopsis vinacea TaxID=44442 RepID=A0A8H7UEY8_9FUNG|nr:hypothetical protein INT44_003504 [Umbelopsis vinacea]
MAMPFRKRADVHSSDVTYNSQAGNTVGNSPTTGAGIGIGVAFGIIGLVALCLQLYRRQQRKKRQAWLADLQSPVTFYRPNSESYQVFIAVSAYEPSLSDEVPIRVGDRIHIHGYYDEEWAYGQNETLAVHGIFPRSCVRSIRASKLSVHPEIASPPMAATRNEKILPAIPSI